MPIMYWVNKTVLLTLLSLGAIFNAFATPETSWARAGDEQVHIEMANGAAYDLKVPSDISGVFYDRDMHVVGQGNYISLFGLSPSNSAASTGFCGAGSEVQLFVYQVIEEDLIEKENVLVSSCLRSVSLKSQNSGQATQDQDFFSVKWSAQGFSIDWFENVDRAGQSLSTTHFVLRDGSFVRQDVVETGNQNN
ncbi:hypothetical protein HNO86_27845 [Pseudomonas sp. C1C7]|uniref:hypothetical protein n=1 Tax=Pseudomonas sp. C1C7 TaxID=2735272 RepID=UPI001585F91D|nr:hypothetical protein [Pseudomonas sp. C1C7]NUT78860.1 hypothetical protein [Pseudomonas sp. C1C7]